MTRKEKFSRCLVFVLWFSILFTIGFSYYYLKHMIPDQLNIVVEEEEHFKFPLPIDRKSVV